MVLCELRPSVTSNSAINSFTFVDNVISNLQENFTYRLDQHARNTLNQPDTFLCRIPDWSDDEGEPRHPHKQWKEHYRSLIEPSSTDIPTEGLNTPDISYLPSPSHEWI